MEQLATWLAGAARVVVLGVGSDLKGDDIAGLLVTRQLAAANHPKLHVLIGGTAPENLTGEIKKLKPSHLLIVDAADLKAAPGTVQLLTPDRIGGYSFSTHALPLKVLVDFINQDHPCTTLIIAIQPQALGFGQKCSRAVEQAAEEVAQAILAAV
jgi:hydrogenase 3 maturation protease